MAFPVKDEFLSPNLILSFTVSFYTGKSKTVPIVKDIKFIT